MHRNFNTAKERTAYLTIYNNDLWYFIFQTDNYTDTTEMSPSDVGDDAVRGFPLLSHCCTPLQTLLFHFFQPQALVAGEGNHVTKKKPPWPLVGKRTIPTERPPLAGEVSANFCG
jgi:hypothetical protein